MKRTDLVTKVQVSDPIHIKAYEVVARAVDEGVAYGWNRAHKHTDEPDEEDIKDRIAEAVMSTICEFLSFSDDFEE